MLSILCVRLTIKVKVGIPESFKVGWYPPKKLGRVTLKSLLLLYCYWDKLTENRHKEPGPRLRRMLMSQSGIRKSMFRMWKKLNRTLIHPFYLTVARILCINHWESRFWVQRFSWILEVSSFLWIVIILMPNGNGNTSLLVTKKYFSLPLRRWPMDCVGVKGVIWWK